MANGQQQQQQITGAPMDAPADCTIACEEGHLTAHKLVLCDHSKYLQDILSKFPTAEHPIIILTELNIMDIRILVNYMYTGELVITSDSSPTSLLRAAQILKIDSLTHDESHDGQQDGGLDESRGLDEVEEHELEEEEEGEEEDEQLDFELDEDNDNDHHHHHNHHNNQRLDRDDLDDDMNDDDDDDDNMNNNNNNNNIIINTNSNHRHNHRHINSNNNNNNNSNHNTRLINSIRNIYNLQFMNQQNIININGQSPPPSQQLTNHHMSLGENTTTSSKSDFGSNSITSNHHLDLDDLQDSIMRPGGLDNKNNKIRCHLCNIGLSDVKCLYRHVLTRHLPEKWGYKCEFCDREFSRDDHLMRHYTTKHKNMEFNREKIRETRRLNREMAKNFHDQISTA